MAGMSAGGINPQFLNRGQPGQQIGRPNIGPLPPQPSGPLPSGGGYKPAPTPPQSTPQQAVDPSGGRGFVPPTQQMPSPQGGGQPPTGPFAGIPASAGGYTPPTGGFTGGMNLPPSSVGRLSSIGGGAVGSNPLTSGSGSLTQRGAGIPSTSNIPTRPGGTGGTIGPGGVVTYPPATQAPSGTPPAGYSWSWSGQAGKWQLIPDRTSIPEIPTTPAPAGSKWIYQNGRWDIIPARTATQGGAMPSNGPSTSLISQGGTGGPGGTTDPGTTYVKQQQDLANQLALIKAQQDFETQRSTADAALQERLLGKQQGFTASQSEADRALQGLLLAKQQGFAGTQAGLGRQQELNVLGQQQGFAGTQAGLGREFEASQAGLGRQQELDVLGKRGELGSQSFQERLAALQGLLGSNPPPPAMSEFGGGMGPMGPGAGGGGILPGEMDAGRLSMAAPSLDSEADSAMWGRQKERTGQTLQGALKALQGVMSQRGMSGSGIEAGEMGQLAQAGLGEMGEFGREKAIQDMLAKRRADELNQQYLLSRRGQDISVRGQDMAQKNALIAALMGGGNLF